MKDKYKQIAEEYNVLLSSELMTKIEATEYLQCNVKSFDRYRSEYGIEAIHKRAGGVLLFSTKAVMALKPKVEKAIAAKKKFVKEVDEVREDIKTDYGIKFADQCRDQLIALGIYHESLELSLSMLIQQFDFYQHFTELYKRTFDRDDVKQANLHYKNIADILKEVGLTNAARKRIAPKTFEGGDGKSTIFDVINKVLSEPEGD